MPGSMDYQGVRTLLLQFFAEGITVSKKPDSWCKKTVSKNGTVVSGGAARNVRIAALGGMDTIVEDVARDTLARAEAVLAAERNGLKRKKGAHLRLVANG